MDALTFLRVDHASVLGMLQVLDGAAQGSGAYTSGLETMVENLIIAGSQHEAIEEQLFWPAVREALDDGDRLADQAVAQEEEAKKLLQHLEDGEPGEPDFNEALAQFVKAAREHISYEEGKVWPRFAAAVSLQNSMNSVRSSRRPKNRADPSPPRNAERRGPKSARHGGGDPGSRWRRGQRWSLSRQPARRP